MQVHFGFLDLSGEKDAELMTDIGLDDNVTTPYYMSIDPSGERHFMRHADGPVIFQWIMKTTHVRKRKPVRITTASSPVVW